MSLSTNQNHLGVWFLAIKTGTGTDVFTLQLCSALNARGIRAEITWLPHHAEYFPWMVKIPQKPAWANIVHLNTWTHDRFIPKSIPIVATMHLCVHDLALRPYKSLIQHLYHQYWIRPTEKSLLLRADKTIAVSHYTACRTQEFFQTKEIQVIPNGIPISPSPAIKAHDPHQPFRLLYVGNWSKRKGVDLLPGIMQMLGPDFELYYTEDAHGLHKKINLPSNCKCVGRLNQEQLQQAYINAHALIFPSRLEGLPLTVMEAMVNSLPVVAAHASSLPELVTNGATGILFPQDDINSAVVAIRKLALYPDFCKILGENSRKTIASSFSLNTMTDAYEKIYRDIRSEHLQS